MLCKIIITVCMLIVLLYGKCSSCPNMPRFYEEIGCKGKMKNHQMKYKCPKFSEQQTDGCLFKKQHYYLGDNINAKAAPPCRDNCICNQDHSEPAAFKCPKINCDKKKNSESENRGKKCIAQNSLNGCCPYYNVCGREVRKLPKCHYLNKVYRKGQIFEPKNSCYKCVCDEKFDGHKGLQSNHNCQPIYCGIELFHMNEMQEGCIPIFYGEHGCCPISYRCPAKTDYIIPVNISQYNSETYFGPEKCQFGSLSLSIGDTLNTQNPCLICKCCYPPMAQCTLDVLCSSHTQSKIHL